MTMLDVAAIWQPALQQQNFRAILDAMARPGSRRRIQADAENSATLAVLAALVDAAVTLADPDRLLDELDWMLLQAPRATPESADFIVSRGSALPTFEPRVGTLISPEQSATLVLGVQSVAHGELLLRLSGPGVDGTSECAIAGLNPAWLESRADWVADFPMGVDLLLVDQDSVLALARTTRVEVLSWAM